MDLLSCCLYRQPLALLSVTLLTAFLQSAQAENGRQLYNTNCVSCHGTNFEGTGLGPALSTATYHYGGTQDDIVRIMQNGIASKGMPSFKHLLSEDQLKQIANYVPTRKLDQSETEETEQPKPPAPAYDHAPGEFSTLDYRIKMEVVADGLDVPWGLAFPNEETILLTERAGRVRLIRKGKLHKQAIKNTPEVFNSSHQWNQGGLLDIALDPNYQNNGWVYLSYSHASPSANSDATTGMIRVVRGKINQHTWAKEQRLFEAPLTDYNTNVWHYGGRMIFDNQGLLYFSVGDRGESEQAREPGKTNGKIHRLNANGEIPKDNPFLGIQDSVPSIFSVGLRNPQGLAIHPGTRKLWATDHGPRGGDELNIIKAGSDYGWPVASHGINYNGTLLTPNTHFGGVEQPIHYWRPSIGVSGISFYHGKEFPLWKGKLLVTGLATHELTLLTIDKNRVQHRETLVNFEGRPYEPTVGPDGAIYVVTASPGQLIRITAVKQRKI